MILTKQTKKNIKTKTIKNFIIIMCTIPNTNNYDSTATHLAKELITNKLAACVTLLPNISSIYFWKDNIHKQEETQLFIKTHKKLEQSVFKYIKNKHQYHTPELLTLNIDNGDLNYLLWINSVINKTYLKT